MSRDEGKSVIGKVLAVATLVQILVGAASGAISGTFRARAEVRDVAADVVREQWLATLRTETTAIALAAAREAADRAIRETVVPELTAFREHRALDQERHDALKEQVNELRRERARR